MQRHAFFVCNALCNDQFLYFGSLKNNVEHGPHHGYESKLSGDVSAGGVIEILLLNMDHRVNSMCKRLFKMQNGAYVFMVTVNFEGSDFTYTEQAFQTFCLR